MTRWLVLSLALLLVPGAFASYGQSPGWTSRGRDETFRTPPPVPQSAPAATLGRPQVMSQRPVQSSRPEILPATYADELPPPSSALVRPSPAEFDVPPPFRPQDSEPPLPRSSFSSDYRRFDYDPPRRPSDRAYRRSNFGDFLDGTPVGDAIARRDTWFTSDKCFDYFVSPVTNPFLFEDPRSSTEIRPLVMIQGIPGSNPAFNGGNAEFFGTQLRVALTDRWSVVMNKLGAVAINPGSGSPVPSGFGFSEIDIGPKFTFLRNQDARAVAAAGLIFQIPAGRASVFQNTGNLSLVPYVSVAKNFCATSYGSFNVMDTLGFAFGTSSARSDYFYNSVHLDFDVMDNHRFYPFLEMHWFYYSQWGNERTLNTEGTDLANIGSTNYNGRSMLFIAPGFRYRFTERATVGVGVDLPLTSARGMLDYRVTIDFSWRY